MREWQPIETAPKDGTTVLVYDGKDVACAAIERDDRQWYVIFDDSIAYYPEEAPMVVNPTHWMPLPAPPAMQQRGGK